MRSLTWGIWAPCALWIATVVGFSADRASHEEQSNLWMVSYWSALGVAAFVLFWWHARRRGPTAPRIAEWCAFCALTAGIVAWQNSGATRLLCTVIGIGWVWWRARDRSRTPPTPSQNT